MTIGIRIINTIDHTGSELEREYHKRGYKPYRYRGIGRQGGRYELRRSLKGQWLAWTHTKRKRRYGDYGFDIQPAGYRVTDFIVCDPSDNFTIELYKLLRE